MKFIINLFVMFFVSSNCYSMNTGYVMWNSTDIFERAKSYALVELVNEHQAAEYIKSTWEAACGCELDVDTAETFSTDFAFQLLRSNCYILDVQKFDKRTAEIAGLIRTNE